jgi:hypothetical protein
MRGGAKYQFPNYWNRSGEIKHGQRKGLLMSKRLIPMLLLIIGLVLLLFVFSPFLVRLWSGSGPTSWEEVGAFGDSFGAFNALFSGLGFVLVVVALLIQQRELRDQQRQIQTQQFEHSFFELLKLHHEIVGNYKAYIAMFGKEFHGRDGFQRVRALIQEKSPPPPIDEATQKAFDAFFQSICLSPSCYLGHYFRNLCQIARFVEDSELAESDQRRYGAILKAQLSDDELALLFYDGLSHYGRKTFKPLLEKYHFFEDLLPAERLRAFENAFNYSAEAFGSTSDHWGMEARP